MRFQTSTIMALLAAGVSAQNYNQTGPFALHVQGTTNKTIDGYVDACHAGAAIEGMCYGAGAMPTANDTAQLFYFNYTGYTNLDSAEIGILTWNLPVNDEGQQETESEGMTLQYQPNSNVAAPTFEPTSGGAQLGFDKDGKLFLYSYYDDSTFTAGSFPTETPKAYYNWYVCYQEFTGYYYQSVGWATTLPPHNPTCQAVTITQEMLS